MDKQLSSDLVKKFIELEIKFDSTGFDKIIKKYDDSSGDSLLEPIIFYKLNEYRIFIDGIEHFLNNEDTKEFTKYLMVLRGVLINSVQYDDQKYSNDIFQIFMQANNVYNYLNDHKDAKLNDYLIQSKKIIFYIEKLIKKIAN